MIEKFTHISVEKARELLERTKRIAHTKSGIDCRVSFVDDYAILKSNRIKLRNVETYDENLEYLDDLSESLIELKHQGVDERDILIDFFGRSNFFYDSEVGFQFIDLNAHNDYHYGLIDHRQPVEKIVASFAFTPCHYSCKSKYLNNIALSDEALSVFSTEELSRIATCNKIIFEKCRGALRHNGISDEVIEPILEKLKIYG